MTFVTGRVLDLIVKTKDDAHALVVDALRSAHSVALGAQANEILALKKTVEDLAAQLKYERARGDGLVDRLLVRDAKVAAVSPAAVAVAEYKDANAAKKLQEIFDSVNAMGAEVPVTEHRAFDMAGGSAVAHV